MNKKILAGVLAVLFVFSALLLGACKNNDPGTTSAPESTTPTSTPDASTPDTSAEPASEEESKEPETPKSYTLNESLSASPLNWNPHSWETNADNYFAGYCEMGFVDVTIAADGVNFEWVYEMATDVEDITKDFADKEKWQIPSDAESEYVYKITLNPGAKWEDGTPINADTYIESIQRLLDPKMQNYRSNTYTSGDASIKNANKYFNSELPIYAPVVPAYGEGDEPDYSFDITSKPVYMHFSTTKMTLASYSINELAVDYGGAKNVEGGFQGLDFYNELKGQANYLGYIELTADVMDNAKLLAGQLLALFGLDYDEDLFKEFLFYDTGELSESYDFANVGIYKTGDYELIYICQDPCDEFNFLVHLTGNWLVKTDIYDAGKQKEKDLVTTNYGTSTETYCSYGPYKLVSFEKDKLFVMEKNDQWYGWTDGKHEGQYQTTAIKCQVIADHNTTLDQFLLGNLDGVELNSTDMATYKMSDYLLKTDQTYTFRYIFATDLNVLKVLEGDDTSVNKRILSYRDFRKAISLAINRADFAKQATPAYKPAYYLYNYLYYYNIANDTESIYRNTDAARDAVLRLYGIEYGEGKTYATAKEAYDAVTGYDVEEAKKLFTAAYEAAKADGNYTDGQKIVINCMCSAASTLDADDTKQQDLLNQYCAEATKGTPLEGKIEFVFSCGAAKRYDDVANGRVEMIRGAWGGAAFYPFSSIRCYTEPDYMGGLAKIHESCGWDPTRVKTTITADFYGEGVVTMEKTLQDWAKLLNGNIEDEDGNVVEKAFTNAEAKLQVLSALEYEVLNAYQCIPFAAETAASLFSKKIHYATLDYNIMYGYGGIRLMTYNYDDDAWAEYVASQGGTLSYE